MIHKNTSIETFHGYIRDSLDAQLLVESCVQGMLHPVRDISISGSSLRIRSGSVVVLQESACSGVTGSSASMRMRWRDGRQWSSSKLCGSFLLYREVAKSDHFVDQTKEDTSLFSGLSLRQGTHLVPNGLAKRTISVDGSDNNRYRVISYFFPTDVQDHYKKGKRSRCILPTPSHLPEFFRYEARVEEMNSRTPIGINSHGIYTAVFQHPILNRYQSIIQHRQ
ncbi:Gti1/Pac2 family-domain-containing protein [Chytriomyces cf. hyalinus JEL632]|nr:Gti1/Pac2 family-domain-containing protein [Chytriomyces cf. hyalinus JEL632]